MSRLALLWLLAVSLLASCSKAPPVPSPARAVRVAEARPARGEQGRRYAGVLEARQRVDLAFRVTGRVRALAEVGDRATRRPIQEGDEVRRGQVLATLDERDLTLQAQAAHAALAAAEAEVLAMQATVGQARADAERVRRLAASGAVSAAELERIESTLAASLARLDATRGQRSARAEQAALARRTTEDLRLVSPFDGVVARRAVDVGENAGPGLVAFVVIDSTEMRLGFAAPDTRVREVHLGDSVTVRLDALPSGSLSGIVSRIDPVADPVTRTFRVELTLPNDRGALRVGMAATAVMDLPARAGTTRIPLTSVVRRPGQAGFAVWSIDAKASCVTARPVELGDIVGNDVEVDSGLVVGDRVVTDGAGLLREGERVEVLP